MKGNSAAAEPGSTVQNRANRRVGIRVTLFFRRKPEAGVFLGLLLLLAFFILNAPNLLRLDPLTGILSVSADIGIVALGVGFLMVSGEFDLSVGSVYLISTLIFVSMANSGVNPLLAFLMTLIICALMGMMMGLAVVKLNIPSFIVTLAGMMGLRGLHVILTKGFLVAYQANPSLLNILAANPFSSFYLTIVWWVLVAIILHIILTRYQYGNWVYATGSNAIAARNIGVPVPKVKITNFALCSMLAGFGGLLNIARYHASQSQLGSGLEFDAITACVIGGVLLTGGKGSIMGVFIGTIFISIIRTGLIAMGLNSYVYLPITGFLLVGAVIFNKYLTK